MSGVATRIAAFGMAVTAPPGWDATIYRRPADPGEQTFPVMHAATVPLPVARGDYGSGVVERLGSGDVFVAVLEFGPRSAGTALFPDAPALPPLHPDDYGPRQLQRLIAGQAGVQRFATVGGRALCLYSVIGAYGARVSLAARANDLVTTLEVAPS